jgi:predicted aspartyl protease
VDQGLNQTLLGQSWLKRVGTVTIEGDRMVLR